MRSLTLAVLVATLGATVYVFTPPPEVRDRLATIADADNTVDNTMYDSLFFSWEPNATESGGLYALNMARIPFFARTWRKLLRGEVRNARLLDVGCGGGVATAPLAAEGFSMTGVDMSPRSIERARNSALEQQLNITYVVGSAYALPFADASFDGVVCSDVMEHLSDLRRWASEVRRVLRPGGVLVFDTINRSWLSFALAIQVLQSGLGIPPSGTHDWRMFIKPQETQQLLREFGFVTDVSDYRGMVPVAVHSWWDLITQGMAGLAFGESYDLSMAYLGYAVKGA